MNDHFYEIALSFIPQLGYKSQRALYGLVPSAEHLFRMSQKDLYQLFSYRRPDIIEAIIGKTTFDKAEQELRFIEKKQIQALFMTDANYPQRLNMCVDAPTILYYRGNSNLNAVHTVGMVGTRRASEYGKKMSHKICEGLKGQQVLIVSGLALGIDAASHQGALDMGLPTVGVVAHGFDRFYPAANKELARKMVNSNGGLLTEFPSGTPVSPGMFPVRNAVIAGMCDCVVVVEAAEKGGALITANIANGYNREVLAVPGRTSDKYSQGCNKLIAYNQAVLINKAEDIFYHMGWEMERGLTNATQKTPMPTLSANESQVYTHLKNNEEGLTMEELSLATDFPLSKLASILLDMELAGVVRSISGRSYKLCW